MKTLASVRKNTDKISKSRLRRVVSSIVLTYLLLVVYFLSDNYRVHLAEAEHGSLMRLAGIANTLALQIDGDAHQRLMNSNRSRDAILRNEQDSDYLKIHDLLARNFVANMLKTPVYTLVLDSSKQCYFGVTSAEMPYFRHPYNSAPSLLLEKSMEGAMIPRYKDEFGVWLSAFSAIRNKKGETVAVVQVDQPFEAFIWAARKNAWKNLMISGTVFLLLLFLLLRFIRPILRRERRDKEALEAAYAEIERVNKELKQSLDQVTVLDGFRREMIANLSHDLRTPMANILGYMETIVQKHEHLGRADTLKYLNIVNAEAKRLNRLVGELFDLSLLESGQIVLKPEVFNIAELAQDILQKYRIQAESRQIELRTDIPDPTLMTEADIRWIDRVMQNLLDNALRYAAAGGFAKFTIFEADHNIHIKVCNNGIPIPEEELGRVFDRYFKGANSTADSTGLGLTIVKKIVDLHQQRIWVETGENLTTFRFTLKIWTKDDGNTGQ